MTLFRCFSAEMACREPMFLPRPRENVRQGAHPPYAGSGVENRDRSGVGSENGRNVPRVLNAQTLNRAHAEGVATCGRQGFQRGLHGVGVAPVAILDPTRPVEQQAVASRNSAALRLFPQAVPDLGLGEHVCGPLIDTAEVTLLEARRNTVVEAA